MSTDRPRLPRLRRPARPEPAADPADATGLTVTPGDAGHGLGSGDATPVTLTTWLRARATSGAVGNVVAFTLVAATAASRAAHGVLSPAGLVAVVVGAAVAATVTGWVAGFYDGVDAALHGRIRDVRPADADGLAGSGPWRSALRWSGVAALWSACGAVVLAAVLRHQSAPFPVVAIALLTIAVPAAVVVDLAARAAGAGTGAALRRHDAETVPLLRRAWGQLALPAAAVQVVVNAGAAWVLFHSAAADGTLTKGEALGDVTVIAVLLASLFGALGARWGAVDAAAGRVAPTDAEARSGRRHPFGPQALVYAGALTVAFGSLAGLVVPSLPSLARVALVRGLLAGGLTLVACALGVVRGAHNTAPLDLGARLAPLPAPVAPARRPTRRLASLAGASAAVAVLALAATPLVSAPAPAAAQDLDGLGLVAELDALGVRVEYDIPLPAGTGSAPEVVGTARRTNGGEVANGIAAAPTRFDAVVGGTVANPDKKPGTGDENRLPQSECAYPGPLADIDFTFPTDIRSETADTPPLGWSSAICAPGPALTLDAATATPERVLDLGPGVTARAGAAHATAGPVRGLLSAEAFARTKHVSILDGLIEVESVVARGASHTDGRAGGARTQASVDLIGVSAGGMRFDVRNGDLLVDGERLPLDGAAARAVLRSVRAALAPSGCGITVLDAPETFPQGFLFTRPVPELGVADDGTLAASMTGGLLVQCDLPQDLTAPTGFSPQRLQVMLGFVYTSVAAREDVGGFGLADVGQGTDLGGTGGGLAKVGAPPSSSGLPGAPAVAGVEAAPTDPSAPAVREGAGPVAERIRLLAANFAAGRPWVWLAALGLWLVLTHTGIERVRRLVAGAVG